VERELRRYLPFLATTRVLVAAVQAGMGREEAHEVIKEHAVAAALALRVEGVVETDLLDRLAADVRLPLDRAAIEGLVSDPAVFAGNAPAQVAAVVERVAVVVAARPWAAAYDPEPIL
jgi:adenylosuccinate lyase